MRNAVMALVLCSLLAGCSTVTEKISPMVGKDLDTTVDLATRYGKPEVAKCATFLKGAMDSESSLLGKIEALQAEPTNGLLSSALKAALLADAIRSLDDPAQRAKLEADFRVACSAVAGDIMMNLARDAAKVARRGK